MQEEYLSRTGQVSPETNNPQNSSTKLYEQSGQADIQNTSGSLLRGQSGSSLLLPDGSSSVLPTNSSVSVNTKKTVVENPSYPPLVGVVISLALVTLIVVVTIFVSRRKDQDDTEDVDLNETEVYNAKQINIVVNDDVEAINDEPSKLKTSKAKKRKKSKKRKKK